MDDVALTAALHAAEQLLSLPAEVRGVARTWSSTDGTRVLHLIDGRPAFGNLDSLWHALNIAESNRLSDQLRSDVVAGGQNSGTKLAHLGVEQQLVIDSPSNASAAANDVTQIVDLLGDDDDDICASGSLNASGNSASQMLPVDPTGLLTWMRDGKIAPSSRRAKLPTVKSPPRVFEEDPEVRERKRQRRDEKERLRRIQQEAEAEASKARLRAISGSSRTKNPPASSPSQQGASASPPPANGAPAHSAPPSAVAGSSQAGGAIGYGRGAVVPARWDESVMLGALASGNGSAASAHPGITQALPPSSVTVTANHSTLPPEIKRRTFPQWVPPAKLRQSGDFALLVLTQPPAAAASNAAVQAAVWLGDKLRHEHGDAPREGGSSAAKDPPRSPSAVAICVVAADVLLLLRDGTKPPHVQDSDVPLLRSCSAADALLALEARVAESAREEARRLAAAWASTASALVSCGVPLFALSAETPAGASAAIKGLATSGCIDGHTRAHAVIYDDCASTSDCALLDLLSGQLAPESGCAVMPPLHCPVWLVHSASLVPPRVARVALQERGSSTAESDCLLSAVVATNASLREAVNDDAPAAQFQCLTGDFGAYRALFLNKHDEFRLSGTVFGSPSVAQSTTALSRSATECDLALVAPSAKTEDPSSSSRSTALNDALPDYIRYRMFSAYAAARKAEMERLRQASSVTGKDGEASVAAGLLDISLNASVTSVSSARSDAVVPCADGDWLLAAAVPVGSLLAASDSVTGPWLSGGSTRPSLQDMLCGTTGDSRWDTALALLRQEETGSSLDAVPGIATLNALATVSQRALEWLAGLPQAILLRVISSLLATLRPGRLRAAGCSTPQMALWLSVLLGRELRTHDHR